MFIWKKKTFCKFLLIRYMYILLYTFFIKLLASKLSLTKNGFFNSYMSFLFQNRMHGVFNNKNNNNTYIVIVESSL